MISGKEMREISVRLIIYFVLVIILLEGIPLQTGNGQMVSGGASLSTAYPVTFTETGLPQATPWTVKVILNNSANFSYTSSNSVVRFNETNGTYNYVALSTTSYVTSNATGFLNVSGAPESVAIDFERTAVSEYYQPFIIMNASQERNFELNPQSGSSALSFGVMNTTVMVQVYNNSGLIYRKNITGEPTNFNVTMATNGYGYVNFQSSSTVSVYATDVGPSSGYFAIDLWNYYISNYSASLITLPPHFQEVFGTGSQNPKISTFVVTNNTGMSFTLVAPYYREAVPFSIWIGEGYYNPVNGNYWWAQVGFNNWLTGMYDVSYAGWGVFSNYVNTTGGTDDNYPLIPNETYTFTMQVENNGTWGFFVNEQPINENGHSAYFKAPTDYAGGNAYLGIEPLVGQRAGPLNSTNFFQGSIVIPNAESFRINGTWEKAANVSFLYGVRDWEDGHGGEVAGMNIWGIEGNVENKSIPPGEIILNGGPCTPYDVPSGVNYDVYPISGNFSFPWQNESRYGDFINVSEEPNGTILLTPLQRNTEVSVLRFQNDSNYVYSDKDMIISRPVYVDNPALDFKAAVCAVPINSSTSFSGYDGIFQEVALEPIFSMASQQSSLFSLGNVSTSYSGQVFVPVYINNAISLDNLDQIYSFDSSLLQFKGTLAMASSQNISFSYKAFSQGVVDLSAIGSFDVISNHTLLFYLVFQPLVEEQISTEILLDSSVINGFATTGNSSARVILATGWKSIGPMDINIKGSNLAYGGMISDVAYSPANMNILYAASGQSYPFSGPNGYPGDTGFGGILKSTDGGNNWTAESLGLTSAAVTSIAVNPQNPNIVVVESRGMSGGNPVGGAIFKTVNGGLSWEQTYSLGGYQLQYLNGILYATTFYSILKSNNFGTTWTKIADFSSIVTSSLILDNGSRVYVGLWSLSTNVTDEILESSDYGSSFQLMASFYESEFNGMVPSISQIVASPSNSSNMWAIIDSPYTARELGNPSLYRSSDGGKTWQQVNTTAVGMGYQPEPPGYITFDPSNGSILYVVGGGSIFMSTNGGNSFSLISKPNSVAFPGKLSIDPSNDNILLLCSEYGLFMSSDRGKNWVSLSGVSTNLLFDTAADNQNIFATDEGQNPLYSNDSGRNWTTITKGYLGVVAVDPYNSSIVIMWTETHTTAGGPFFFVSNSGGNSFFLPSINFTAEINPSVDNIAFSNGEIFVPGGTGIFSSTDSGATWSLLENSPRNASTVVDSPSEQNVIYADNCSGLYKSTNYGVSWSIVNHNGGFDSLAVDPLNSSILAGSAFYSSGYRPMMSYSGGETFIPLGISSIEYELSSSYVYFYEISGRLMLVFTSDQGLFVSSDLGITWSNYSYNLPSTVINSFYASPNGTSYVATYGSGIFIDQNLFNLSYHLAPPVISGYLPSGSILTIDGVAISRAGYFSMVINPGNNSIDWEGERLSLVATQGDIYFFNFSNMQIFLSLSERNLPVGSEWNVSANGKNYSIMGNGTLTLPPGTSGIYVLPVATDYSIYCPSNNFYPLNSSLTSSIVVQFNQTVRTVYSNVTSSMNGMFWSTQAAYNRGLVLYVGGGPLGLLNVTSNEASILQIPNYAGIADTVVPFGDGFLIGGSASPNRPGIYYYNISTHSFANYSGLLPATWNDSHAFISSIFGMNSSAFGFIGGGVDSAYFGIVDGRGFINLTSYLPSSFTPSNGWYDRYSGAYLSSYQGFVLSDGADIGIFYLQNKSFHDISPLMPNGFYVGTQGNEWSPSSDFISSNDSTAIISGTGYGGQFTVLYNPGKGIKDISSLFPSSEYMDTATWHGRDIVLSGHESIDNSSSIFIYNTSRQLATEINTTHYGNTSLIDSAIMVGNSVYFTTFNVKHVPNQSYVIDSSYYGAIKLTPTGSVNLKINALSTTEINNESYYAMNATIPEFAGNYTLTVSSPGFVSYAATIDFLPFETIYLDVTLAPKYYGITFIENGLTNGTFWSVTLNGTTGSSTSDSITFQEPNGTYNYSIGNITGYNVLPTSGKIVINGNSTTESISFTRIVQEGYFAGSVSPSNATISIFINGIWHPYKENNGSFNVSLNPGTYRISISAPGYTTYTTNITVSSSTVTSLSIHSLSGTARPASFPLQDVAIIAIAAIVIIAIAAVLLIARRRRG